MGKKMSKKGLCICSCLAVLCLAAVITACNKFGNFKKEAVIEVGSPVSIDAFFDTVPEDAAFLTDVSGIDTRTPAVYQLRIHHDKRDDDVVLRVEDHTPPTGNPVPVTIYTGWRIPEASECITDAYDFSGVAKIEYKDGTPEFTADGTYDVPVVLTDVYGNSAILLVKFTMVNDSTGPEIGGLHDFEVQGNPGAIDYLESITVTDNYDPEPRVSFDDSGVDYTKVGTYKVVYKAMDKAGNISTAEANVKVTLPSEAGSNQTKSKDNGTYYVGDGDPYAIAKKVMKGLYRGNDVETARAIFNWVHDNLWFRILSGKRVYEHAAYRGFTKHSGDCFVYYSCCKMLLDLAGIENMRVDRYPPRNGQVHFWLLVKLNGQWYHCDATEGYSDHPGIWFMCTDKQIADRYHNFNGALYPARAGGSTAFASPTPVPTDEPEATPTPVVTTPPEPTAEPSKAPTPTPQASQPTPTSAPVATPTESQQPQVTSTPVPTPTEAPVQPTSVPVTKPTEAPKPTTEPEQ